MSKENIAYPHKDIKNSKDFILSSGVLLELGINIPDADSIIVTSMTSANKVSYNRFLFDVLDISTGNVCTIELCTNTGTINADFEACPGSKVHLCMDGISYSNGELWLKDKFHMGTTYPSTRSEYHGTYEWDADLNRYIISNEWYERVIRDKKVSIVRNNVRNKSNTEVEHYSNITLLERKFYEDDGWQWTSTQFQQYATTIDNNGNRNDHKLNCNSPYISKDDITKDILEKLYTDEKIGLFDIVHSDYNLHDLKEVFNAAAETFVVEYESNLIRNIE